MILTTSRRPCKKSRNMCKELEDVIPLAQYIVRGKKGIRELVHLSEEKGADRLVVVTSGNKEISLLFYSQFNFLGMISGPVVLRRELNIPPIPPVPEDILLTVQSSHPDASIIADLFGAHHDNGYAYMVYKDNWIDFYRLDISDTLVGPRINVEQVTYAVCN
jgi:hypothetical protein